MEKEKLVVVELEETGNTIKDETKKRVKRNGKSNPYSWHNVTIYMSNRVLNIVDQYKKEKGIDKFPYKEIFEKGLAQEFPELWNESEKKEKEKTKE